MPLRAEMFEEIIVSTPVFKLGCCFAQIFFFYEQNGTFWSKVGEMSVGEQVSIHVTLCEFCVVFVLTICTASLYSTASLRE